MHTVHKFLSSANSHPSSVVLMAETEGPNPNSLLLARTEKLYVEPDSSPFNVMLVWRPTGSLCVWKKAAVTGLGVETPVTESSYENTSSGLSSHIKNTEELLITWVIRKGGAGGAERK